MRRIGAIILSAAVLFSQFSRLGADTGSEGSAQLPQWVKDVRRTEIITFGSLPFVTLWTTVGYSMAVYGEFKNPFDKSTSSFTENDQWNIIQISAATCIALGLADLCINLIKRKVVRNRIESQSQAISVVPLREIEHDDTSENHEKETERQPVEKIIPPELFIDGVESAVF